MSIGNSSGGGYGNTGRGGSDGGASTSSGYGDDSDNGGLGSAFGGLGGLAGYGGYGTAGSFGGLGGFGSAISTGNSFTDAVGRYGLSGAQTGGWANQRVQNAQQIDPRAAMEEALSLNELKQQAGLISGAEYANNRESIYSGEVGNLTADLAGRLTAAYSAPNTGFLSMIKNMWDESPKKVTTPYSALTSLIDKGYAAPGENNQGFVSTPRAAWDSLKGFLSPFTSIASAAIGGIPGAVTGLAARGLLASGSPMGIDTAGNVAANIAGLGTPASGIGNTIGAINTARDMQTAGVQRGDFSGNISGAYSDSPDTPDSRGGLLNPTPADGYDYRTLGTAQTIDPLLWFNNKRNMA